MGCVSCVACVSCVPNVAKSSGRTVACPTVARASSGKTPVVAISIQSVSRVQRRWSSTVRSHIDKLDVVLIEGDVDEEIPLPSKYSLY